MDNEKKGKIRELFEVANAALEEARALADDGSSDTYFRWDGPTYGMGGWISSGEWQASSNSC